MPGGSPEHYYGSDCVGAALGLCANTKGGVCVASPKHHRLASASIALLLYLRHCPPSLARHSTTHLQLLRNGTGCTPSPTLGLARHVRCDPDHPSPPPWAPPLITTTKSPKALHPAGLGSTRWHWWPCVPAKPPACTTRRVGLEVVALGIHVWCVW